MLHFKHSLVTVKSITDNKMIFIAISYTQLQQQTAYRAFLVKTTTIKQMTKFGAGGKKEKGKKVMSHI
jgi:hypothetical protein